MVTFRLERPWLLGAHLGSDFLAHSETFDKGSAQEIAKNGERPTLAESDGRSAAKMEYLR